jgi:hypothetical protein
MQAVLALRLDKRFAAADASMSSVRAAQGAGREEFRLFCNKTDDAALYWLGAGALPGQ